MLLQNIFICCLMFLGAACVGDDAVDLAYGTRHKRNLDFGVFLNNLFRKSVPATLAPMRPIRPSTTTTTTTSTTTSTTTTTTPAPPTPMMPLQPFLQKSFYRVIPGLGRVGFGLGFTGNLENQRFFYPLDFDYNDDTVASTTPTTTSTTSTTPASTTTTTEAPKMSAQSQSSSTMQLQANASEQSGASVIYQYVPDLYYNTQTSAPTIQHHLPIAPINYDYYDAYSVPQRSQPPSYDYEYFFKTRSAPNGRVPVSATSARPIIAPPVAAFNSRSQLSDNLIYQFAPNHDIYSKAGANFAQTEGDAARSVQEISSDTAAADGNNGDAVTSDDSNENNNTFDSISDGNNNDGSVAAATVAPTVQRNNANIDDITGPLTIQLNAQNYGYNYDTHQNEVPYSSKPYTQNKGLFVVANQLPKGDGSSYGTRSVAVNSQPSFASMRFRSPFANFQTSTINNGYNRGQQFQRY